MNYKEGKERSREVGEVGRTATSSTWGKEFFSQQKRVFINEKRISNLPHKESIYKTADKFEFILRACKHQAENALELDLINLNLEFVKHKLFNRIFLLLVIYITIDANWKNELDCLYSAELKDFWGYVRWRR